MSIQILLVTTELIDDNYAGVDLVIKVSHCIVHGGVCAGCQSCLEGNWGRNTYTFTNYENDSPECGILSGSTIVEIYDDDKMPAVYRRTRNRCPGKAQQMPFVPGSGLSDFGSVSVKRVKGKSPMMPSIIVPMDYGLIQAFSGFVD
ncbi:hypothetical protein HAX54_024559 [Datura stramonium]|uniref:Uncharacterized protein n=1 Tax=Datura stramonium TaxID=4076 RepID=A0ABS8UZY7_DATST|nr:hypothetical protein [Datura stramonium]